MKRRNGSDISVAARKGCVRRVLLAGMGNIGSVAADLCARLPIDAITLCDPSSYEAKNVAGQAIEQSAVGRFKVAVIAEHLKRIRPDLKVHALHCHIQDVPLGTLRHAADALLCAFDGREPRAYANQMARQLGIAVFIDGGVEASQLLARVNVHRPSGSCLQCGWSEADYDLMEVSNPCQVHAAAPATNAPAALGALAASMMAIELKKVIDGDFAHVAAGKQIVYCALTHRLITSELRPNPDCHCEHKSWRIERLAKSAAHFTLADALKMGSALKVPGKVFSGALVCQECKTRRTTLRLDDRFTLGQLTCRRCGNVMVAPGSDQVDWLERSALAGSASLNRPLASLGIVDGDVLCLRRGRTQRVIEIGRHTKEVQRA